MLSSPVITTSPRNQTVTVGDNVTLHCRFHSDIEAYIHWFKLRDDVITASSSGQSQLATDWNSFLIIQVRYLLVYDTTSLMCSNLDQNFWSVHYCVLSDFTARLLARKPPSVCLSVCLSVTKCTVVLRVGVGGLKVVLSCSQ